MKVIDRTKFRDDFYNFLEKNWKGVINYMHDELYPSKFKSIGALNRFRIGKIQSDSDFKEVVIQIKKKYLDYENLRNVLKDFESKHKGIKVTIEIVYKIN